MQINNSNLHTNATFLGNFDGSCEYSKTIPETFYLQHPGMILNSKRNKKGFTLIELMLAITISVVVVGTVYVTFYQSHKVTQSIMAQTEVYQMARLCMDRMMKDLNCIYFSPYLVLDDDLMKNTKANELAQKYRFLGKNENDGTNDTDKLYFTTTSDIGLGDKSGILNEVDYELKEDPDNKGMYFLIRREDNKPHDGITESARNPGMEIAENVVSMNILYYDKSGKESDEWDATSTAEPALPYMIKITLTFKNGKDTYTFTSVASPVLAKMQSSKTGVKQ
jgi:prepilin-type N-terminal cleavage/methylation domain-containing protein